jgi:hypothetical protein
VNRRERCLVRRADAMDLDDRVVWAGRYAPDRALLMSPSGASQLVTWPQIPMVQATRRIQAKGARVTPSRSRPSGHMSAPSLECRLIGNRKTRTRELGESEVEQPISSNGPAAFAHRILDRLTAMKLRIGSVRLRLRLGAIAPAEIENHLGHIEQEIDAAAALAQDMQAEGSSSR